MIRGLLFYPAASARMIGGFASSFEAKNTSMSEAPSPSHSERADSAFISIQLRLLDPCV